MTGPMRVVSGEAAARRALVCVCDEAGSHCGQGLLLDLGPDGTVVLTCQQVLAGLQPDKACVRRLQEDGAQGPVLPARYDDAHSRPGRNAVVLQPDIRALNERPVLFTLEGRRDESSAPVTGLCWFAPSGFSGQLGPFASLTATCPTADCGNRAGQMVPLPMTVLTPIGAGAVLGGSLVLYEGRDRGAGPH